jgi:hypothetical protein
MNAKAPVQAAPKSSSTPARTCLLQRKCACGGTVGLSGECEECCKKRIQRRASSDKAAPDTVPPIVDEVLRSPGQPLDPAMRAFMELHLGHDFSGVRVHTDAKAAASAGAVNALAYTVGRNVVFGAGHYAPGSPAGLRLLAHELTHTIQQGSVVQGPGEHLAATEPGDSNEREAEAATKDLALGRSVGPLRRQPARLARWAISGSVATSNSESDRLGMLAAQLKAGADNWVCVKPIQMRTAANPVPPSDFNEQYERYVQVGDTFDLSNMQARGEGNSLRINFHSESGIQVIGNNFYPGLKQTSGDADSEISKAASEGKVPLSELIMLGHSSGGRMFGSACELEPSKLDANQPTPTFSRARAGQLPRRCWFTLDAQVRSVGCSSGQFGLGFAGTYLRQGASISTTLRSIGLSCTKEYRNPPEGGRDACQSINGLEFFQRGDERHQPKNHGPFQNAEDLHASSFWETIDGSL